MDMSNSGSCLRIITVVAILVPVLLLAYFVNIYQFGVHPEWILL